MHRNACQQFFLQPSVIGQRRYEVLRAVFVEAVYEPDWRDCFCSCRSWPDCGSIDSWNKRAILARLPYDSLSR